MRGLPLARRRRAAAAALALALAAAGATLTACQHDAVAQTATPVPPAAATDVYTPVVAIAHTPMARPVDGNDGKVHLVYELRLMNARPVKATVLQVDAVDASGTVLGTLSGAALLGSLRTLDNHFATTPHLESSQSRLLLMHLVFDSRAAVPTNFTHRLHVLGGSIDGTQTTPIDQDYAAAPLSVSPATVPVLGPPLRGRHWAVINGCCEPTSVHRNTGLPVNGDIRFAQRFAIDYMRLNDAGYLVQGAQNDVTHYTAYGADVLAVADGTVVDALDTLDDQVPPTLPPPASITLATADGNHLVIDIGHGLYAFYAHLQKGAIGVKVKIGDRVIRGQSIGTLGNSGNSSAPHLHFHLMDSPSVLGSNGLPFTIDSYTQSGQITDAMFGADGIGSYFGSALSARPVARSATLPLDQAVVDFP